MTSVLKNNSTSPFYDDLDTTAFREASRLLTPAQLLELLRLQQQEISLVQKESLTPQISLADARKLAASYTDTIWHSFEKLKEYTSRYETQIRKKWKKMSFAKRVTAIKSAWPTIPLVADDGVSLGDEKHIQSRSKDLCLYPYINIEDLCRDPSHLLGLLYYRSRHSPDQYALLDLKQATFVERAVIKGDGQSYLVKLYGGKEQYGKATTDNSATLRGDAVRLEDALVVLESQSRLLSSLIKVSENLLSPKVLQEADSVEEPAATAPDLMTTIARQKNPSNDWTSRSEICLLQPFSSPPIFSLKRIGQFINTKRDEVQDRLWILKKEPLIMYQYLRDYDEHRLERIPGPESYQHSEIDRPIFYDRVVGEILDDLFHDIFAWESIEKEFNRLNDTFSDHESHIACGTELPKDIQEVLASLDALVRFLLQGKIEALGTAIMASPQLREAFYRKPQPSLRDGHVEDLFTSDRTLWLLLSVVCDANIPAHVCSRRLDELEQIMLDKQQEASRIDPFVLQRISDVATLYDILLVLQHHRPSFQALSKIDKVNLFAGRWHNLTTKLNAEKYHLGKNVTPYSRFTQIGHKKDHGKKNHADEALRQFWRVVHEHIDAEGTQLANGIEASMVTREEGVSTTSTPRRGHKPRQKSVHFPDKISTILIEKHEPVIDAEPPTPTLKIRPVEGKLQVTDRHIKTICKLFPSATEEDRDIGQIEWKDFVACMISLGFSVERKRGVDWLFIKKAEVDSNIRDKAIIVREEKKLSPPSIKVLERRLNRRFMWTRSMFELAEKA